MKKYLLLALMAFVTVVAPAQTKKAGAFGDAHGESDFFINWKKYYNYEEWCDIMQRLAKQYPDLCSVESIGKSRMGRDQLLLTITNKKTGKDTEKPAAYVDGAIHGNEVNGVTDAMYLAWYLLTRYKYDPEVAAVVDRSTVYILPALNVDAVDSYVRFPNTENNPREPFRPIDDDKDGLYDDDMTEDVDGDGELSNMYMEDAAGDYRLSKDGLRFLRIGKDDWWEGKRFRLIGTEGYDNDGDGRMAEDDLGGIDPNRVYPFDFRKSMGKSYPLSEPVTRNQWNFVMKHKNIMFDVNYHNYGREIMYMYPPSNGVQRQVDTRSPRPGETVDRFAFRAPYSVQSSYQHDAQVMNQIVSDATFILNDYHPVPGNEYGETLSSMYYILGAYSLLIELWDRNVPYADANGDGYVNDEEYAKWVALDLGEDAWVKPHKFNHPQLGEIWIGGTNKKHIGRTPPPRYMEDEAMRQSRLVLHVMKQFPELKLKNAVVKKAGNNLYQVEVDVVNDRFMPTASDRLVLMKKHTPDVLKATVNGGTLVEPAQGGQTTRGYEKSATAAGQKVEFRTRGNSVTTFRYTIVTTNPKGTTLNLDLNSLTGGKDQLKVTLQ